MTTIRKAVKKIPQSSYEIFFELFMTEFAKFKAEIDGSKADIIEKFFILWTRVMGIKEARREWDTWPTESQHALLLILFEGFFVIELEPEKIEKKSNFSPFPSSQKH